MKSFWFALCVFSFVGVGAIAQEGHSHGGGKSASKPVTVGIINLENKKVGTATFSQAPTGGLQVDLDINNMPPGTHMFHIHNKAKCEPSEQFNTATGRFDPTGEFYGDATHFEHAAPSAGDPGKGVDIKDDGTGRGTFFMPKLTMGDDDHSVLRGDGTAIIFHSAKGATGPGAIACGVIKKK